MTDEQKNKMLKARLTKCLTYLGGTKEMLIENEIAFKVKVVHKCIFKYPYKKIPPYWGNNREASNTK